VASLRVAAQRAGTGDREFMRVRTIVRVGLMIARAALRREESRGGHFRSDFPNRDDIEWRRHVADRLGAA
jgi:L-aspartate oxidase